MCEENDLLSYFQDLPDPRVVGRCDHKLLDIVAITICAVICGIVEWEDTARNQRRRTARPASKENDSTACSTRTSSSKH